MRMSLWIAMRRRLWPVIGVAAVCGCSAREVEPDALASAGDAASAQLGSPAAPLTVAEPGTLRLAAIEFDPPPPPVASDEEVVVSPPGHAPVAAPAVAVPSDAPPKPSTFFVPKPARQWSVTGPSQSVLNYPSTSTPDLNLADYPGTANPTDIPAGPPPAPQAAPQFPPPPAPQTAPQPALVETTSATPTIAPPPTGERSIVASGKPEPTGPITPSAQPIRSRDMDHIAQRADAVVRRGFELASRGAVYSAQAEFHKSIRIVAQALDAQHGTTRHTAALVAGLTALDESDDFVPRGSAADRSLDLDILISAHKTTVLKSVPVAELSTLAALQRYYTYAQEQLAVAGGRESVASLALYGLGKIHALRQSLEAPQSLADGPKAIALHQAALAVDGRNYMAANELGVLLARCGQLESSRQALEHSLAQLPQPATWHNLAIVCERLGDAGTSVHARQQAQQASTRVVSGPTSATGAPQSPVVWLEAGQFSHTTRSESDSAATARAAPVAVPTPAAPPRTGSSSWFPFGKQSK